MTDKDRQILLLGALCAVAVLYVYSRTDDGAAVVDDITATIGDAVGSVFDKLREQLALEEGRRNIAYQDTRGVWTIGIGHTGPEVVPGLVWSDEMVDSVFLQDAQDHASQVTASLPWVSDLDPARQVVLYQMGFQLGIAGLLKFTNTLAAVRQGRYSDAARGMLASLWAKQTPARARRLARQMETGVFQ